MFARPSALALLLLAAACGTNDGDSQSSGGSTTGDPSTTAATTTAASETPTSTTTTGDEATGDATTASTTPPTDTGDDTTQASTTGDPTTGADTTAATATTTTDAETTTGEPVAFEKFRRSNAAGPCPPNADCDGFIELLADGTLRVEKFGEIGDPVIEVQVDADDLAAAIPVFTDPDLIALLDGPDPLCDPPTDVFEDMAVDIDGATHDAATTFCDQPPIAAARAKATELQDKYVP